MIRQKEIILETAEVTDALKLTSRQVQTEESTKSSMKRVKNYMHLNHSVVVLKVYHYTVHEYQPVGKKPTLTPSTKRATHQIQETTVRAFC